jgi:hypothetical protein
MGKLTVFFEAAPGSDLQHAAAAVQEKAAALPNVESASAQSMVTHSLGPQEIMMGLQVATNVMTAATTGIIGLTALIQALKKLSDEVPALSRVLVQVGLKKVPADQLTEQDLQKLAATIQN